MSSFHSNARSERLDTAKGILMTSVVLGHAIQFVSYHGSTGFWADPLFVAIYMFHMPLFMAYSGYLSPKRAISASDIGMRAISLLYPMMPWAVITALLRAGKSADMTNILLQVWRGFLGSYWFLWCAFLSFVVLWLGQKSGRFAILMYAGIMAALMLGPVVWSIQPMFAFVLPFFLAGHVMRQNMPHLGQRWPVVVATVLAVFAYSRWDEMTYIYNNDARIADCPDQVFLMFVGASAATVFVAYAIMKISVAVEGTWFGRGMSRVGRLTLEIYLVQGVIFAASYGFVPFIMSSTITTLSGRWIAAFSFTAICMPAILIFIHVTKRQPIISRFLWGR